jgi:uncharacterized protein YndB with AHSA1/START domain
MVMKCEIEIKRPRADVWDFFTNFELMARIFHEAFEFEFLSVERAGVGVEWHHRAMDFESPTDERHKLLELDFMRRLKFSGDDLNSYELFEFWFEDFEEGTKVVFELTMRTKGLINALLSRVFKMSISKMMYEDLLRTKNFLETAQLS